MASTKRISHYANGLIAAGVNCKIIIANRTERLGQSYGNCNPGNELYQYIGNETRRSNSVIVRKWYDYLDTLKTIIYIRKNSVDGDIILNYLREDILGTLVIFLAKKSGVKVIRDLCEYPYGTGGENVFIQIKRKLYLNMIMPQYDGMICISQPLYDLANKYIKPKALLIKVPILVDAEVFDKDQINIYVESPFIFHSGTLTEQKDGILGAIEAFAMANNALPYNINFVLTGNLEKSQDCHKIKELISKYSLQNSIIFKGNLSSEEVRKYQKNSVLMIVNKRQNLQNTYCFATKIGEYLMSGKPLITTNVGEAMLYLDNGFSAHIVQEGNLEQLASKILEVLNNPLDSKRIGLQGRQVAQNCFSYLLHGKRLKLFLENLTYHAN